MTIQVAFIGLGVMSNPVAGHLSTKGRNASLPLTAQLDQFYGEVENVNGARWESSSLFARMEMLREGRV